MITIRHGEDRGRVVLDWLDSRHSFSFGHYYDPKHMGFRALRVINDDRVSPGGGFATHPHRDMEIITYVLDGVLEHADSLGNGSVIRAGEVQRMTAGTGVTHSEFNHSQVAPVHLLQIWILPAEKGLAPSYEQRAFTPEEKRGGLTLVAARDGRDGALTVHQDAEIYAALLDAGKSVSHRLAAGRHAWLHLAHGAVVLNGHALTEGDGAAVSDEEVLAISAETDAELLLFDLA
ncbi:MAG: pirin family protein [Alphaproteobacteria bacterium]